jgi:hypothetical protein
VIYLRHIADAMRRGLRLGGVLMAVLYAADAPVGYSAVVVMRRGVSAPFLSFAVTNP